MVTCMLILQICRARLQSGRRDERCRRASPKPRCWGATSPTTAAAWCCHPLLLLMSVSALSAASCQSQGIACSVDFVSCFSPVKWNCLFVTLVSCFSPVMWNCLFVTLVSCFSSVMWNCLFITLFSCFLPVMWICLFVTVVSCFSSITWICLSVTPFLWY